MRNLWVFKAVLLQVLDGRESPQDLGIWLSRVLPYQFRKLELRRVSFY